MEYRDIIHFDATARRREKMQQAARGGNGASDLGSEGGPPSPSTLRQLAPPNPAASQVVMPQIAPSASPRVSSDSNALAALAPATVSSDPTPAMRNELPSPDVSEELESFLINFVVEQTGYPQEFIELDVDLEADLGIDSIKKAQMFGELREHFEFDMQSSTDLSLDDFPTLRHVLEFLHTATSASDLDRPNEAVSLPPAAPGDQVSPSADEARGDLELTQLLEPNRAGPTAEEVPAAGNMEIANTAVPLEELEPFLVNFVVEQTGYPVEIIELDADLEADLGIDSIKKAQMFGELREVFAIEIEASEGLSLDDFPTLRHILEFLNKNTTGDGIGQVEVFSATASPTAIEPTAPVRPVSEAAELRIELNEVQLERGEAARGAPSNGAGVQPGGNGSRLSNDASIMDVLRRILIEEGIADAAQVNLTRRTLLMDDVGLDSVGMLDLVQAAEKAFAISISLDDMELKDLNSTSAFASLIQRKLAGIG